MKKFLVLSGALIFFSAMTFAGEFKPSLHTSPSVRQQGFGGFYSTDLDNFYGIYANPAILGLHKKHSLFPSIDVRAAGLLKDSMNIINAVSNKDMEKLGKIIKDNNGIQLGLDVAPLLSFGHISDWGFGWAFNTQMFVNASVPSVTLSDVNAGVESVLRAGYGFSLINTENHCLSIGATAKGFVQVASSYNGSILDFLDKVLSDFNQLPAYFTAGFGFDVGAVYTLANALSVSVVWEDAFTEAFISSGTFGNFSTAMDKTKILDSKLAVGAAFSFPVGWSNGFISSLKVMADYRNIFTMFKTFGRNPILELSCGAELVLGKIFSFRFGMSEMYPAVGVGIGLGAFKLDFAMYGKELGLEPGSSPCLNSSLFIGFTY
ncbi:MAG: hypothetical protein ACI4LX_03785 [Treponema sp.]